MYVRSSLSWHTRTGDVVPSPRGQETRNHKDVRREFAFSLQRQRKVTLREAKCEEMFENPEAKKILQVTAEGDPGVQI